VSRLRAGLLWLLCVLAGPALGANPVVRAAILGKSPHWVGQPVTLQVDILVPNFFMSAPKWPQQLQIPGAVANVNEGATQHLNETIGGEAFVGIRQTYLITAQTEGEFTLPAVKIPFDYAAVPGQKTAGSVTLPALKFKAELPAGAKAGAGGGTPAPVARVTLKQTLDRTPEQLRSLKVGDALTRRVEAYAERTQAMMIPPPAFDAPAGVRVYRQDPVLADESQDRVGFVGGRRTDRATYVFEREGRVTLPEIDIAWFNAQTGQRELARAPAIELDVAPNPGFAPAIAPAQPASAAAPAAVPARPVDWRRWAPLGAAALLGLVLLAWLVRHALPRLAAWLRERRAVRASSEPAAFARIEAACRAGQAAQAYATLLAWRQRAGIASMAELCALGRAADLRVALATLEKQLYGGEAAASWNGAALAAALRTARRQWIAGHSAHTAWPALPPLNP